MSWKKYFRIINTPLSMEAEQPTGGPTGTSSKYSSYLPEVYAGPPNRIQRYFQYDDMDKDSDINAALDTIADFCTQSEKQNDEPLLIRYNEEGNATEIKLLKSFLNKWVELNAFRSRLWYMFRGTIKNGDQFFLRDPQTGEWLWLDHFAVEMVKADDDTGKAPDAYIVRGLDANKKARYATVQASPSPHRSPYGAASLNAARRRGEAQRNAAFQMAGSGRDQRPSSFAQPGGNDLSVVSADHVVHLSLSVGMDVNWPFGQSVLEPVFKTFKQKELLEDSIIIYRVQRAPERRVFYIDVGNMPPVRARAHIEAIKTEIHQRRIPNRSGGGASIMDATYNPLSIIEDYFFAQTSDGRGSKVETLPGGDSLGEIGDLSFFSRKLARGLRIPSSYLSLGDDGATYQDGKLGAALVQEYRFTKHCLRLQALLAPVFDREFKRFLCENGVEIDPSLFSLHFNPPQNFAKYREIELMLQRVQVYQGVADNKKLSERFKLTEFLGLTQDKLIDNERMWAEENADLIKSRTGVTGKAGTAAPADTGNTDRPSPDAPPPDADTDGDGDGNAPADGEAAPPPAG